MHTYLVMTMAVTTRFLLSANQVVCFHLGKECTLSSLLVLIMLRSEVVQRINPYRSPCQAPLLW